MRSIANRFPGAIKGKKEPGIQEICAILNFDEAPLALVDSETGSLVFINSKLIKLSYYSQQDVNHKDVKFLLPGLELETAYSGENRQLKLDRKNLSPIEVRVRFDYIDPAGKWLVLRFIPTLMDDVERKIQLESTYRRLTEFIQLSDSSDLMEKIQQGVGIIRQILDCGAVCLYQRIRNTRNYRGSQNQEISSNSRKFSLLQI